MTTKTTWPIQDAVILSESDNFSILLNQILHTIGWKGSGVTRAPAEAMERIRTRKSACIIVDDSPEFPAPTFIRHLLSDPFACVTPIFCFLLEQNRVEGSLLQVFSNVAAVTKPLTPSTFVPAFNNFLKKWETQNYLLLRKAAYHCFTIDEEKQCDVLSKLVNLDAISVMATGALAVTMCRQGKFRDAEKVLLEKIKKSSDNILLIVLLGDIYLRSAMPHLASRLFQILRKRFPHSLFILPDVVQAEIMNGNFETALTLLEATHRREFLKRDVVPIEVQLYLALERIADAKKAAAERQNVYRELVERWEIAEGRSG